MQQLLAGAAWLAWPACGPQCGRWAQEGWQSAVLWGLVDCCGSRRLGWAGGLPSKVAWLLGAPVTRVGGPLPE
jgi:hypothetical protein